MNKVFRVNNVITHQFRTACSCQLDDDDDDFEAPLTLNDALVEAGKMSPAARDKVNQQRHRADQREAYRSDLLHNAQRNRPHANADEQDALKAMLPPSLGDLIRTRRAG